MSYCIEQEVCKCSVCGIGLEGLLRKAGSQTCGLTTCKPVYDVDESDVVFCDGDDDDDGVNPIYLAHAHDDDDDNPRPKLKRKKIKKWRPSFLKPKPKIPKELKSPNIKWHDTTPPNETFCCRCNIALGSLGRSCSQVCGRTTCKTEFHVYNNDDFF